MTWDDPLAQYRLALMYYNGWEGVELDIQRARKWMEKASKQGYAPVQYSLGVMYSEGEGGVSDLDRAVELWKKASKQGDAPAQYSLAVMYYIKGGSKQDTQQAINWHHRLDFGLVQGIKKILEKLFKKKKK